MTGWSLTADVGRHRSSQPPAGDELAGTDGGATSVGVGGAVVGGAVVGLGGAVVDDAAVAGPGSGRWTVGTVSVSIVPTAGGCPPAVVVGCPAADDAAVSGDVEALAVIEARGEVDIAGDGEVDIAGDGEVDIAGLLLPKGEAWSHPPTTTRPATAATAAAAWQMRTATPRHRE